MKLQRIKVLAILASSLGLVGFEVFRHFVLHPIEHSNQPHLQEHVISAAVLFVGVVAFSLAIFRLLDRVYGQVSALNAAAVAVTQDLSVDSVLERVAELARAVASAPAAAVHAEGDPPRSVTSGSPPPGATAFSFPIVVKGHTLGELKLWSRRLRPADREALQAFAIQAGIALENARLYEQVEELAAMRERIRIGMDLHDGMIQHLYAIGLQTEDAAGLVRDRPDEAAASMTEAQAAIRALIGEVRGYVFGLRALDQSIDLRPALENLAEEHPRSGPSVTVDADRGVRLPATVAAHALQVVREAVANARRHAHADHIVIRAARNDGAALVTVSDDGRGFDPAKPRHGLGIQNMRERTRWCRGSLDIRSASGSGTLVSLTVPAEDQPEAR